MSFDQNEVFAMMYKLARLTDWKDFRLEYDPRGNINVPLNMLFGPQTARHLEKSNIGGITERMPEAIIKAFGVVKMASAQVNRSHGVEEKICSAIINASKEVISGKLYEDNHFPLSIWQAGSGRQTNVNVNEVISNRAIQILGGQMGSKDPVHPRNHVNLSQSSNDSFSTAINIAAATLLKKRLFPALQMVIIDLLRKQEEWKDIKKVGRTQLMEAAPMTLGQEISGYKQMMINSRSRLESALHRLYNLSVGGNSVGTGLFCPKDFGIECVERISEITGIQFVPAPNLFEAIASRDILAELHGDLNTLAVSCMKMANDIRFLGSGPRCGIGELILPINESGSSIMPGKTNPTQCESLTMICAQVMGNQAAVTIGCANGHFQLNDFMPMIAANVVRSITLLADGLNNFSKNCLRGMAADRVKMKQQLHNSLVMTSVLVPHIGYDKTAEIASAARSKHTTLRNEAIHAGVAAEDFDKWMRAVTEDDED